MRATIVLAVLATIFGSIHKQPGRSCGMTQQADRRGHVSWTMLSLHFRA